MKKKSVKWPSQLIKGKDSDRPLYILLAKQLFWPLPHQMICSYYLKPEHYKHDYYIANGLCLASGTGSHLTKNCSFRRIGNIAPIQLADPLPLVRRNPGLVDKRTPFSPSDIYSIRQREDQEIEQMVEGGKHINWLKRKPKYWVEWEQRVVLNIWNRNPEDMTRNHYPYFFMFWVGGVSISYPL